MRTPKYLSNTSVSLFYQDREEFYLRYLADNRPPRMQQTRPMSVGSAFDAYVKSWLVTRLALDLKGFGKSELFEMQVEPHNRDWALIAGQVAFDAYQYSGALAALLKELEQSKDDPQFETTKERVIDGVPLLGKPDVYFITREDMHVIIDWKVNGYCSKSGVSPKAGYIQCLDGWDHRTQKQSKTHGLGHKNSQPINVHGITINMAAYLEDVDITWANQTTLYAWLEGEPVGGKFITGIDQLACGPKGIRIARHRARVSEKFQQLWWFRIKAAWEVIQSGVILKGDDAIPRQALLDDYHKAYSGTDPNEKWFQESTREY